MYHEHLPRALLVADLIPKMLLEALTAKGPKREAIRKRIQMFENALFWKPFWSLFGVGAPLAKKDIK